MSATDENGKPDAQPAKQPVRQQPRAKGQRVSHERGAHKRSKKNPGKRTHQGGS